MSTILILVLFVLSVLLTAMSAGFSTLSTSHLRHWAKKKDPAASKLYPLKARGSASFLTIELLRALSLSAVVVLLTTKLAPLLAWAVASICFFLAFVVLTQLYLKPLGIRLLVWLSTPLLGLTNALKPVTWPLGRVLDRFIADEPVTLTRHELSDMLDSIQPEDTDLHPEEIKVLSNVLEFRNKTVHDIMIKKSKVVTIKESETLTPIVLDELHKSGHGHFPVTAESAGDVIGMLNMHDGMDLKSHDKVVETIMQKAYFVDEDRGLDHVLEVFYKTRQPVFVVLNAASDMVGIVTIADVVQQILGKPGQAHAEQEQHKASEEPLPVVE